VGLSYTHIAKAEGKQLFTWVLTEASMRSGQKSRKNGVTLYTEQPIYAFYDKYRTEFFSLCLAEAKGDPKYASGSPPASVGSEHEANLWTAVWMSTQEGFDLFDYTAELQAEYLRERQRRGYAHTYGPPLSASDSRQDVTSDGLDTVDLTGGERERGKERKREREKERRREREKDRKRERARERERERETERDRERQKESVIAPAAAAVFHQQNLSSMSSTEASRVQAPAEAKPGTHCGTLTHPRGS
jgi:hypothetical protein